MSHSTSLAIGLAGGMLLSWCLYRGLGTQASHLQGVSAPPASWVGKRVLITGASSGIGRACAIYLARQGASIGIHYHSSRAGAEETLRCVTAASASARGYLLQASLGGSGAAGRLFEAALAALGGVDVLVLSAGIYEEQSPGCDTPAFAAQFSRVLAVNLQSSAELVHACGRYFAKRQAESLHFFERRGSPVAQGAIVGIGSRGALRGEPSAWAYAASKAGLHALMQSAAVTLGAHGVSCTAVAPGWVDTPMASSALSSPSGAAVLQQSPWRRVATPEEVAAAVEALARYWDTAFCTGTVLDVNGASYLH